MWCAEFREYGAKNGGWVVSTWASWTLTWFHHWIAMLFVSVECHFEQAPNPNLIITRSCLHSRFGITHPKSREDKQTHLAGAKWKLKYRFYSFQRSRRLAHLLRVVRMPKPFVNWPIWWFIAPLNHTYFSRIMNVHVIYAPLAEDHSHLASNGLLRCSSSAKRPFLGFCKFGKWFGTSVLNNCFSSFVYSIFLCFVLTHERLNPRRTMSFANCIFPAVRRIFVQTMTMILDKYIP